MNSIQVLDGGLHQPPVFDVPQYPHDGFDAENISEFIDKVLKTGLKPVLESRENYIDSALFSLHVFNVKGEELASYQPIMKRGLFHAKTDGSGRIWSVENKNKMSVGNISLFLTGW